MARRSDKRNIRNIQKSGGTYYVTLPISLVRARLARAAEGCGREIRQKTGASHPGLDKII